MSSTSRQRVVDAMHHRQPDKIPIDFASTRSTGINAYAYRALLGHIGLQEDIKIFDFKQFLAQPSPRVLELFQSDCLPLYRRAPSGLPIDHYKEVTMGDGNTYLLPEGYSPRTGKDGAQYIDIGAIPVLKKPAGGMYFDDCYHPLAEAEDTLPAFSLPSLPEGEKDYLSATAKDLFENTDKAIVASSGISIFERGIKDWGFEEFLVRLYTDRKLIDHYLNQLTEAYMTFLDGYLEAIGPYVQVIQCNDDLGMQTGGFISPELYRTIFKPYHARLFEMIHKKVPGVAVMLHSCGSIYELIPDLIEAGVDVLNPVQINAAHMDPATLKREFGRDVTFWGGGCSTQDTLTFGTPIQIRDEVRRTAEIFSQGGGFVFNQVHNIQSNVAPEQILAMYDAIIECRGEDEQ